MTSTRAAVYRCYGIEFLLPHGRTLWYPKFAERWLDARSWHRPMVLSEYRAARDAYIAGMHLGLWLCVCDGWRT